MWPIKEQTLGACRKEGERDHYLRVKSEGDHYDSPFEACYGKKMENVEGVSVEMSFVGKDMVEDNKMEGGRDGGCTCPVGAEELRTSDNISIG